MIDPQSHSECLDFIRAAIAENCPQTARDVASVIREVCSSGYANRDAIWLDLSSQEQQRFSELIKTSTNINIQEQQSC